MLNVESVDIVEVGIDRNQRGTPVLATPALIEGGDRRVEINPGKGSEALFELRVAVRQAV